MPDETPRFGRRAHRARRARTPCGDLARARRIRRPTPETRAVGPPAGGAVARWWTRTGGRERWQRGARAASDERARRPVSRRTRTAERDRIARGYLGADCDRQRLRRGRDVRAS